VSLRGALSLLRLARLATNFRQCTAGQKTLLDYFLNVRIHVFINQILEKMSQKFVGILTVRPYNFYEENVSSGYAE